MGFNFREKPVRRIGVFGLLCFVWALSLPFVRAARFIRGREDKHAAFPL